MITQQRYAWRSFAGGELCEELYGRLDLPKNQTGLKRCSNFAITPQGALEKRSGTKYMRAAKNATAYLDVFIRSDGQGFLLEFGHQYVRIHNAVTLVQELVTPYASQHVIELSTAQFVDDMTLCHKTYAPRVLHRNSDVSWSLNTITFNATLAPPTGITASAFEAAGLDPSDPRILYTYAVTTTDENGAESAIGGIDDALNILRVAGSNNTIDWLAVTGAFRYNVYCARGTGGTFGFIGAANGLQFIDDNINPDVTTRPPDPIVQFNSVSNYPGVCTFHDQRALFANTETDPQSFWASGLSSFSYFKAAIPPQQDQAFTYEISSKRASPILHMLALRDVLFFTDGGVHRVFTATGEPFAPDTVSAIQVCATGSAAGARPQEAGNSVLYPAARGGHLTALKYDSVGEGYTGDDISLLAPHLIDGYTFTQTAFQRAPYPVWYGRRSDGKVMALTYVAEQEVYAWWQLDFDGAYVTSIAVVPEGSNDSLYIVARRVIDGDTVHYIERVQPRFLATDAQQAAYFVDCGVTYVGDPTLFVNGLDHLEGEEVVALAEGRPMGPYTVTNGEITIEELSSVIQIGKRVTSELELLPLAYAAEAYGVGDEKNPSAVHLRLKRSDGIQAGPSFDELTEMPPQLTELIGNIQPLRDGIHTIDVQATWSLDGSVCIRQDQPLPAAITGIAVEFVSA
ncbi:MAG: hypothetical protein ABW110_05520 [Steroidobacteraceae bacterium]